MISECFYCCIPTEKKLMMILKCFQEVGNWLMRQQIEYRLIDEVMDWIPRHSVFGCDQWAVTLVCSLSVSEECRWILHNVVNMTWHRNVGFLKHCVILLNVVYTMSGFSTLSHITTTLFTTSHHITRYWMYFIGLYNIVSHYYDVVPRCCILC